MLNKRGRKLYVPPAIIDELQDIQREDEVQSRAEAFRKLVKYARVGRETQRLIKFDWTKAKKRTPVDYFTFDSPKKKKKNDMDLMQRGII